MRQQNRSAGTLLLGALTAGVLATSGLGSAPAANATCASFFGIGNSADCTSNLTSIAIAIGTNAQAHADGLFGTAFAVGTQALANTAVGAFTFATAVGDHTVAGAYGLFGIATGLGPNGLAAAQGSSPGSLGVLNFALNVSLGTTASGGSAAAADGIGNVAVNLFGNGTALGGHEVVAWGNLNGAMTLGGTNNKVSAGQGTGTANYAFSILGSGNTVKSGPGPVAIAGSILQTGQLVTKVGPGFNINGVVVGGAAAVQPTSNRITKPAAAGTRTNANAAASRTAKK